MQPADGGLYCADYFPGACEREGRLNIQSEFPIGGGVGNGLAHQYVRRERSRTGLEGRLKIKSLRGAK